MTTNPSAAREARELSAELTEAIANAPLRRTTYIWMYFLSILVATGNMYAVKLTFDSTSWKVTTFLLLASLMAFACGVYSLLNARRQPAYVASLVGLSMALARTSDDIDEEILRRHYQQVSEKADEVLRDLGLYMAAERVFYARAVMRSEVSQLARLELAWLLDGERDRPEGPST